MASFLTIIIFGVADMQKMAHAGWPFFSTISIMSFFVMFNGFPVVQGLLGKKTACWDLTGSSVIKLYPKIIAFCKAHYWTKRCANEAPRIPYADM